MERDVFIEANGQSCSVWQVEFRNPEVRRHSDPCRIQEQDGTFRKGRIHYTIESAEITFCTTPGSLEPGREGQLSTPGDRFYEVRIGSVTLHEDHAIVSGHASRKFNYEPER